jgi:hypothetical protein
MKSKPLKMTQKNKLPIKSPLDALDNNRSQIQKILGGQNEIIAEPSIEGLHSNLQKIN